MFVSVTDYRGNPAQVDPTRVIKIRQSLPDDPRNTVLIDFASGGLFAREDIRTIVRLFGSHIRLANLHAPDGTAIFSMPMVLRPLVLILNMRVTR